MIRELLVVVAKRPELGRVKTRLARGIGDAGALALYAAFLDDIVARCAALPHTFAVAFVPGGPDYPLPGVETFDQVGATLGERLLAIFERSARVAEKTLVMSSDSPQVPDAWIERAFEMLEDADAVFGPTEDGGYWCVGMRLPHDVFGGVTMSVPETFEQTRAAARRLGLRVALLPPTFDVDEVADLAKLRAALAAGSELPRTRRVLAELDGAAT